MDSASPPSSTLPTSLPQQRPSAFSPPSSILIIGSGVFGLSTAWALARRDTFSQCSITVIDRSDPSQPDAGVFPARDAASIDTSRIIRADYSDASYAALAAEAQVQWRKQNQTSDLGAEGRYSESGLVLVADAGPTRAPGEIIDKSSLTGMDYVRFSWDNVRSMASSDPDWAGRIHELPNPAAIREQLGTGGSSGTWGYFNGGSGWADAEASMAWLFDQVVATGRVVFVHGDVVSLQSHDNSVTGAKLSDGRMFSADLVVLAAGAWTGGLIDLSGQVTATGQVLGYLDLTEAEQEQLGKMPVILNMSSGLFIIPPRNRMLKIARHAYGYLNPTSLAPLASSTTTPSQPVSYPLTHLTDPSLSIPKEGADDLRRAIQEMVPLPGLAERPFTKTRICWYADTPTADFIVDYHPHWTGLFVATGDSGHAFKFMPVLGDKIVDCITHNCPREFLGKWNWKSSAATVVTEDGSRGGISGLILSRELNRDN
ncbi:FAD dependent oxidoreductase [Echria macrotheca]|uniref:FAD dependent oxidoreductase n=1 Tax=Echria macrotheca TaxID=438768 RepID=A0AAJ0BM13_9PEZI|nr:FAD dependent oxidoreductase [Echria macrotheca]